MYRFFEILPGALSWTVLLGPIIAAFWFPRAVAIFITIYVLLWFLRLMKSSMFLMLSYRKSKQYQHIDWDDVLTQTTYPAMQPKDILHVAIIPTFKEEKEILESSITALKNSTFPLNQLIVVLATEERDQKRAEENAAYLTERFGKTFRGFWHVMHPANLPGEIPAKGANISFSGAFVAKQLAKEGVDFQNVIVTTLDADNHPHPLYFSCLTHHYLLEPARAKRSFQPLAFFYNNIWEVPFANRLVALANTFWYLAESGESEHLFNASVYAQSLETLVAVDFWSKQTIVEDLNQYWRTYFHFRGEHEVIPLFIPVYQDALQSRTYFTSLIGQYKQLRRWAWGASEIPHVITKWWHGRTYLPFRKTFSKLSYLWYLQLMWATAPVIIFLNKSIPSMLNPQFQYSLISYNLGRMLDVMFTIVSAGIIVSLWITFISLPRPAGRSRWGILGIVAQFVLLPFVTILYGAIPALDAQTRLMLNKPLGFNVTEKIRKIN